MYDLKKKLSSIKNTVLNISPIEAKVREATNSEAWNAKVSEKQEIADATYNYEDYKIIMSTLWKRINDVPKQYRHIHKGLQLLEYLLLHGDDKVIDDARDSIYTIKSLQSFKYYDETGRDCGAGIRETARRVLELVKDDKKLDEEREKAKKNIDRYQGFSRQEARFSRYRERRRSPSPKRHVVEEVRYQEEEEETKEPEDFNAEFEEEPFEEPQPIKKPEATRPRAPSLVQEPPKQQQKETLDISDIFKDLNTQPTDPFSQPQTMDPFAQINTDPFSTAPVTTDQQPDWNANFSNQQSGFEDDFQDFQKGEEKKSELLDFTKGLVNIDALGSTEKKKEIPQTKPKPTGKKVTLNQLAGDTSKMPVMRNPAPMRLPPTMPTYPPHTMPTYPNYPPTNYPPQGYPPTNYPPRPAYPPQGYPPNYPPNYPGYPYNYQRK